MSIYIHYGSSKFHSFLPVHNQPLMTKPFGGLWGSPIDSPNSWKDWCLRNKAYVESLNKSFQFTLSNNARIIHLYSVDQLKELPKCTDNCPPGIDLHDIYTLLDFEKIQQTADGIELHLSEERHTEETILGHGLYFQLYGWDCDSILIFNDKIVQPL